MGLIDFLYADHERVASFLSQLGETDGVLKEVSSGATRSKTEGSKGVGSGGIFGFSASAEGSHSQSAQREARLVYDPLWANSLKLIDAIATASSNALSDTPEVGQLRQISGSLRVFDISYLPALVMNPAMTEFIRLGQEDEDEDDRTFQNDANGRQEAEVTQAYLGALPFGIQFLLNDHANHFWFNLKRQYLSLYDLDIPLKFPQKIPGVWKAIGIVDAAPNDDSMDDIEELPDRVRAHIPPFMQKLSQLPENTNEMFGRQDCTYGLSPLMIYRELNL
jgi:hypothetical protein